jgi:hypothetical protein
MEKELDKVLWAGVSIPKLLGKLQGNLSGGRVIHKKTSKTWLWVIQPPDSKPLLSGID